MVFEQSGQPLTRILLVAAGGRIITSKEPLRYPTREARKIESRLVSQETYALVPLCFETSNQNN